MSNTPSIIKIKFLVDFCLFFHRFLVDFLVDVLVDFRLHIYMDVNRNTRISPVHTH